MIYNAKYWKYTTPQSMCLFRTFHQNTKQLINGPFMLKSNFIFQRYPQKFRQTKDNRIMLSHVILKVLLLKKNFKNGALRIL